MMSSLTRTCLTSFGKACAGVPPPPLPPPADAPGEAPGVLWTPRPSLPPTLDPDLGPAEPDAIDAIDEDPLPTPCMPPPMPAPDGKFVFICTTRDPNPVTAVHSGFFPWNSFTFDCCALPDLDILDPLHEVFVSGSGFAYVHDDENRPVWAHNLFANKVMQRVDKNGQNQFLVKCCDGLITIKEWHETHAKWNQN